jgi:hypothetical protein
MFLSTRPEASTPSKPPGREAAPETSEPRATRHETSRSAIRKWSYAHDRIPRRRAATADVGYPETGFAEIRSNAAFTLHNNSSNGSQPDVRFPRALRSQILVLGYRKGFPVGIVLLPIAKVAYMLDLRKTLGPCLRRSPTPRPESDCTPPLNS